MNEFESEWISLGQSFVQNGWIQDFKIQDGRIQDGSHFQVDQIELVWFRVRVEWECFWGNLREDNKVSESNMAEFKIAAIIKLYQNEWVKLFEQNGWILDGRIQDGRIEDGRIQDGCHLQVNQIELVWFRARVEWECFWVNLREDNKVYESMMAVAESNMAEFKMAAIIKLIQNEEWRFFVQMVGTNLGKCEWVWEEILRWQNPRWQNSR